LVRLGQTTTGRTYRMQLC